MKNGKLKEKDLLERKGDFLLSISIIALVVIISIFFQSCSPMEWINDKLGMKDDNILEEAAESFIESKTGLDIDLTQRSPEHASD